MEIDREALYQQATEVKLARRKMDQASERHRRAKQEVDDSNAEYNRWALIHFEARNRMMDIAEGKVDTSANQASDPQVNLNKPAAYADIRSEISHNRPDALR